MTEADLEVLAGFEAVWRRVTSGNAAEPARQEDRWAPVLQGLHEQRQGLERLSRLASGKEKYRLCALAGETKALFDRLQTEYFLETGDIFLTMDMQDFASYTPYNLRKLWKNAIKLAGALQNAAQEEETLLSEAAETVRQQADKLKQLIRQSLQ